MKQTVLLIAAFVLFIVTLFNARKEGKVINTPVIIMAVIVAALAAVVFIGGYYL